MGARYKGTITSVYPKLGVIVARLPDGEYFTFSTQIEITKHMKGKEIRFRHSPRKMRLYKPFQFRILD